MKLKTACSHATVSARVCPELAAELSGLSHTGESGSLLNRRQQAAQFAAIDKGFEDVLLHLLVARGDVLHFLAQGEEVLDCFVDFIVLDVIGRDFDAKNVVVAHIMFGEAILLIAERLNIGDSFNRPALLKTRDIPTLANPSPPSPQFRGLSKQPG